MIKVKQGDYLSIFPSVVTFRIDEKPGVVLLVSGRAVFLFYFLFYFLFKVGVSRVFLLPWRGELVDAHGIAAGHIFLIKMMSNSEAKQNF